MPIITTFDPATAASDAVGAYADRKRQNAADQAARDFQQRQADLEQSKFDLDRDRFNHDVHEDDARDAAQKAKAITDAQHQANEDLHQARVDALAALKERDAQDKNDKQYALDRQKIEDQFKLGIAKIQGEKDVANIHAIGTEVAAKIRATATVQSANIRAGATIDAANTHETGADRRAKAKNDLENTLFTKHDLTTRRGQDLNTTTKVDTINAANGRSMANAVLRLGMQKDAPKPPTPQQDPRFAEASIQFAKDSPAARAKLIANPNVPAVTRQYFQALVPFLNAAPAPVPMPDLSEPDDDDE